MSDWESLNLLYAVRHCALRGEFVFEYKIQRYLEVDFKNPQDNVVGTRAQLDDDRATRLSSHG